MGKSYNELKKAEELKKECKDCGGEGKIFNNADPNGGAQPCPTCSDGKPVEPKGAGQDMDKASYLEENTPPKVKHPTAEHPATSGAKYKAPKNTKKDPKKIVKSLAPGMTLRELKVEQDTIFPINERLERLQTALEKQGHKEVFQKALDKIKKLTD